MEILVEFLSRVYENEIWKETWLSTFITARWRGILFRIRIVERRKMAIGFSIIPINISQR